MINSQMIKELAMAAKPVAIDCLKIGLLGAAYGGAYIGTMYATGKLCGYIEGRLARREALKKNVAAEIIAAADLMNQRHERENQSAMHAFIAAYDSVRPSHNSDVIVAFPS